MTGNTQEFKIDNPKTSKTKINNSNIQYNNTINFHKNNMGLTQCHEWLQFLVVYSFQKKLNWCDDEGV